MMTDDPSRQDKIDAAIAEFLIAEDQGAPIPRDQWLRRHADLRSDLVRFLDDHAGAAKELHFLEEPVGSDIEAKLEETADFDSRQNTPNSSSAAVSVRSSKQIVERVEPGQRIGGIELVRRLGAGGMGEVFEGIDAEGRSVAVKLLQPGRSHTPEALERFRQEGAIASSIVHPRCVFVRTVDRDGNRPFIVMDLMTGRTLRDLVRERGRLHYREAVRLILDAAEGLEEAHSHGMIHRDVKPANCYLEKNGRVKIGDFGLARSITDDSELTQTGEFVGTPLFASPEQVRGEELDTSTDIYSLAATLYYLLTGQAPFGGLSAAGVIARIVSDDPSPPTELGMDVPPELERVLLQALSRSKANRPASMELFQAQLRPFVSEGASALVLGKRFAAYMADVGILTIFSMFIFFLVPWGPAEATGETVQLVGQPARYQVLGMSLGWWIYFTLTEIWNGQSFGKRMLGLRVAVFPAGHRPAAWRIVWRTLLLLLILGGLTDWWLYNSDFCKTPVQLLAFQYGAYLIQFLLACSTLWIGDQRRMLHDWLSNTFVVSEPHVRGPMSWDAFVPCRTIFCDADELLPRAIDRFTVKGRIGRGVGFQVLEAQDSELARRIWIRIEDEPRREATPPADSQIVLGDGHSRVNQMRVIENGVWHDRPWVAYVAVDGAPLRRCQFAGCPDRWSVARDLLLQWCEECAAMQNDGIQMKLGHADQIWLDRRGRLVILDFPVDLPGGLDASDAQTRTTSFPTVGVDAANQGPARLDFQLRVAAWMARQVLCDAMDRLPDGKADDRQADAASSLAAIVPLHARRIIDRITGTERTYQSLDQLQTELRDSLHRPTRVNISHRMIQFAIAGMTVGALYGASLSLVKSASLTITRKTGEGVVAAEALRRFGSDSELRQALAATLPDDEELPSPQQFLDSGVRANAYYSSMLERRAEHFNRVESLVLSTSGMEGGSLGELSQFELSFDADESKLWKMQSADQRIDFDFGSQELVGLVRNPEQSPLKSVRDKFWLILLMASAPMLLLWCWDTLTRGGFACWAAGLRFVDSKGRRAGRARFAVRSLYIWGGPIIVAALVCGLDVWCPDWFNTSKFAFMVFAAFPLLFFALSIISARRGVQDYLAGTYVVPR